MRDPISLRVGMRRWAPLGLAMLVAGLCGCGGRMTAGPPAAVGLHVGQSGAFIESGVASVEAARPHTDPIGLAYLGSALDAFKRAGQAMLAAESANRASAAAMVSYESEIGSLKMQVTDTKAQANQLRSNFWSQRQRALFWKVVIALALVFVLRLVGLYLTGGAGQIAAFVGTGLLGLITGGLSLVQALFDNLWFRRRASGAQEAK